jgi:hypothetical protein
VIESRNEVVVKDRPSTRRHLDSFDDNVLALDDFTKVKINRNVDHPGLFKRVRLFWPDPDLVLFAT